MTEPAPYGAIILLRNQHVAALQTRAAENDSTSVVVIPGRQNSSICHVKAPRHVILYLYNNMPSPPAGMWICGLTPSGRRIRNEPGGTVSAAEWQTRRNAFLAVVPLRLDENGQPLAQQPTTLREAIGHSYLGDPVPDDDEDPDE